MAKVVASSILCTVSEKLGSMIFEMGSKFVDRLGHKIVDEQWSKVVDTLQSLTGVCEELKKLHSTLSAIESVMADAEKRQVEKGALADWLKKLKDVAYEIDDLLDEAAAQDQKHKINQRKRKHPENVSEFLLNSPSLFPLEIAKKIKKIRERLDEISKEKTQFHLREGASTNHSESEVNTGSDDTGSFVDKYQVFGRDGDKERIVNFLLSNPNEKNIEVISIVGLGGLGKTTLAQLVCSDRRQVPRHFKTKIWVNVAQKFEIKKVIVSIIESLLFDKKENTKVEHSSNMDLLEKQLLELIKGKRFLLVLDNVWTVNSEEWDRLSSLLRQNCAKGSKVIVSTRDKRVAFLMKSNQLHQLEILQDDDCWKLFKKTVGIHNDEDSNLVDIGKEIVDKCGGLPLAIKSLGSILYREKDVSQWIKVRDDEIWRQLEKKHGVLVSLRRSYNHLSSARLKQCFAYCSIFPKGMKVKIKMIEQLWIAEGFVGGSSDGSDHIKELISKSLFENATEDGCIKMHEMVHNLAQFVAGDECLIIDATRDNNTNILQNIRYTSLVLNGAATQPIANILGNAHKLRTFYLIAKDCDQEIIFVRK